MVKLVKLSKPKKSKDVIKCNRCKILHDKKIMTNVGRLTISRYLCPVCYSQVKFYKKNKV